MIQSTDNGVDFELELITNNKKIDKKKIISKILNEWVCDDENSCGTMIKVIDSNDIPEIVTEIVEKLKIK